MTSKKTVILGASTHPWRYAYMAANKLTNYGHEIIPIGIEEGILAGKEIVIGHPEIEDVHTVTMYLNPKNQEEYYEYILDELQPERIVFNPGSENPALIEAAKDHDIEVVEGCTLVMLSAGQF